MARSVKISVISTLFISLVVGAVIAIDFALIKPHQCIQQADTQLIGHNGIFLSCHWMDRHEPIWWGSKKISWGPQTIYLNTARILLFLILPVACVWTFVAGGKQALAWINRERVGK